MRLPPLPDRPLAAGERAATGGGGDLPLWPPLLATRGPGGRSAPHAHHAMHFVLAVRGTLRVRLPGGTDWVEASGALTAADAPHEVDATGVEVLLVFLDPESEVGAALAACLPAPVRLISAPERAALVAGADPHAILRAEGTDWTQRALQTLARTAGPAGARGEPPRPSRVHPRVRKLLRLLRATDPEEAETSLEALARAVGLSPGRLMHAFTQSLGIPLRPYLAWLRLQRAAGAIVSGRPLSDAAHAAGFADAAHMTRTFRRMFGVAPSALRPPRRPPAIVDKIA